MRILIAEDDSILADGLIRSLRQTGYAVDHVDDGCAADSALALQTYDLLILDLGLPKRSGLDVLRRLRARGVAVPVLILTAADSIEARVTGLDLGADDYMAKPFALSELEARIRALTRRGAGGSAAMIRHGALTFDQVGRTAALDGRTLDLSARELELLEVLLQRVGRLVSKEQLVDHLCEWGEEVSTNAIEVYMHRLRKKIEPGGIRVTTVRGIGYCLDRPAPTTPDVPAPTAHAPAPTAHAPVSTAHAPVSTARTPAPTVHTPPAPAGADMDAGTTGARAGADAGTAGTGAGAGADAGPARAGAVDVAPTAGITAQTHATRCGGRSDARR